jgi:DNA-binding transcriptional LysR family regulator
VRIAFVPGVTLGRWTTAWEERNPKIPLGVSPVSEAASVGVLHSGEADLSFVRLPIEREGLSVITLYSEIAVVVVPVEDPLTLLPSVTPADLEGRTLRSEPDISEAVELVAAGVGILVVPHSIARLHARKDVEALPLVGAPSTDIAIAWLSDKTTAEIEEFVGIVRGRTAASSRGTPTPPTPVVKKARTPRPAAKPGSRTRQPRKRRGR